MSVRIINADVMEGLRQLPDESVHCVVTSPPYWGLRDYGIDGQIGMERTLGEHISRMVEVLREVRRIMRKDATLWLNYGDCYATSVNGRSAADTKAAGNDDRTFRDKPFSTVGGVLKPKDLCMIPHRMAIALQEDGWWVRMDNVWAKPNPMPESITDRPTKSHEYVFLLTKSERYFYDAEAIKEPVAETQVGRVRSDVIGGKSWNERGQHSVGGTYKTGKNEADHRGKAGFNARWDAAEANGSAPGGRNKRSVWTIATAPYPEAHFATFPPELPEICILAGTSQKGCCAKCGAPWGREVETEREFRSGSGRSGNMPVGKNGANLQGGGATLDIRRGPVVTNTTTGWSPSCSCNADVKPCTVLDPFSGAGTTALVADRLQRNAIGIELNPTYAAMSEKRINGDRGALLDLMEAAQ
jgi:DNA modification methylase